MIKCKVCNNHFEQERDDQIVCSDVCALEHSRREMVAEGKRLKKEWLDRKRELKIDVEKKSFYEKKLQVEVNKLIRLIDEKSPCMMCGKYIKGQKAACHYYSVGSNPILRFHLDNIHIGCVRCNSFLGGNERGYDEQLIQVYGKPYLDTVKVDLKHDYQEPLNLDKQELIDLAKKVRKVHKDIKSKKNSIFTIEERLDIRKEINEQLGIYK